MIPRRQDTVRQITYGVRCDFICAPSHSDTLPSGAKVILQIARTVGPSLGGHVSRSMSDKPGYGRRNGRSSSSKPREHRDQVIKHLIKRPPHLARSKSSALPEIISVAIIGIVLTVFPWHVFRDEAEPAADSGPWGSATVRADAFAAPAPPCSDVATGPADLAARQDRRTTPDSARCSLDQTKPKP